ncbi:hypothetical protein [Rhodoferax sp. U11-2br]|uniref:hypothetical protein n=1 Tax=Rhodoferax sp. U11-2br TaxID=2838878 RepID=UPI001BE97A03|nr:hypothetical protein [Rhodoferax sp. U11-2br]MBT3067972.1 hypothetical protein [Rhodoferax sp. U11-2br]
MRVITMVSLCAFVLLAGCATPKEVLQYANNGVSLANKRAQEMTAFEKQEIESEKALAQSLGRYKSDGVTYRETLTHSDVVLGAVEDTATIRITQRLTVAVTALGALASANVSERSAIAEGSAKLLSPLPSTTAAETAFQQKLAVFGRELTNQQRLSELAAHVQTINKNISDGKAATAVAAATAASAPR